jgi:undecaprenyl-diphosphatase
MQAVATAPGISRSGSTISGSLFRGLSRETAARFSFLMSIPIILGAALAQLAKGIMDGDTAIGEPLPLVFGFVAAALAGYLSVKFMLKLIRECKLRYFACYVFVLAVLIVVDSLVLHVVF